MNSLRAKFCFSENMKRAINKIWAINKRRSAAEMKISRFYSIGFCSSSAVGLPNCIFCSAQQNRCIPVQQKAGCAPWARSRNHDAWPSAASQSRPPPGARPAAPRIELKRFLSVDNLNWQIPTRRPASARPFEWKFPEKRAKNFFLVLILSFEAFQKDFHVKPPSPSC